MSAMEPARPRRLETAAWLLGILLFGGIALTAVRQLIGRVQVVAGEIASRQTLAGIVAVILYALVAVGWLIAMTFVARRLGARWTLGIGLAGCAAVRVAVAFGVDAPLVSDWLAYHTDAIRFVADGVSLGDRPPGYPALLGAAYALLGAHAWVAEALNLLLALLVAAVLFDLLRRASGLVVAGVGIGLFAILPSQALLVPIVGSEVTYTAALLVAIWCLAVIPGQRPSLWRLRREMSPAGAATLAAVAAGVVLGLSQFVRPSSIVLLPAFVILAMRVAGARRPRQAAIALVLAFVAVLLPVVIDNAVRHGQLSVTTSSYGGFGIYVGANQEAGGRFNEADAERLRTLPGDSLRERSDEAGRLGVRRILEDPAGFARLAVRKQVGLWGSDEYAVFYAIEWQTDPPPSAGLLTGGYLASQAAWTFIALAAAWGVIRVRRPLPLWLLAAVLLVASIALLHAVVEVQPRYHAYLTPLVVGAAALGLAGRGGRPPPGQDLEIGGSSTS